MSAHTALRVADSFRVRAHPVTGVVEARAFDAHIARFRAAVLATAVGNDDLISQLDSFLADAATQIADFGEGWPRLELWGTVPGTAPSTKPGTAPSTEPGTAPSTESNTEDSAEQDPTARTASPIQLELRVALRPLPPLHDTINLRTAGHVPVAHPELKGPNLEQYSAINRDLGAEGVLLDRDGHVLEGTTTSLLWWQRETLHRAQTAGRLASITEALTIDVATAGSKHPAALAHPSSVTLSDLAAFEVWAVNALHGIRPVRRINGVPAVAPDAERLARVQAGLDLRWKPVRFAST